MIGRGKSTSSWSQMSASQLIGEIPVMSLVVSFMTMTLGMILTLMSACGENQKSNFREDKKSRRHMALLKLE